MSETSQNTTHTDGGVFPITLFARVLEGSEGTFIVTATPPKLGEDAPGVAVRPISTIDYNGEGSPIAAALLREVSELHADAALRINPALRAPPTFYADTSTPMLTTMFAVDGDGTPVPIMVPLRPSLENADAPDIATDDFTTEEAGEE